MSTDSVQPLSAHRSRTDSVAKTIAWIWTVLLVLLAVGTITESQPGTPIRLLAATLVHTVLALFPAPPVRWYLATHHDVRFHRATVAMFVLIGVIVNEGLVAPQLA